ncbi:hypothetical protein ACIBMZ_20885 [Micromonospora sp. NPDC049900]|uniref:hypothetical protein n=1 Tax=Micromonospora sp. NPDC049900 TaxID=3364275 RepID=UPI0037A84DB4
MVIVFVYTLTSLISGGVTYVVTAIALRVVTPDLPAPARDGVIVIDASLVCGLVRWSLPEIVVTIARLANAALRMWLHPAHHIPTGAARSCPACHSAAGSADASAVGHGTRAGRTSGREEW